jgi:hypothetical protein
MRSVTVEMEEGGPIEARLPCTGIGEAIANLEAALPLFEAIAGDATLGRQYWQAALDRLKSLPLPYLALHAIEVMFMDEPGPYVEAMTKAMAGDASAIAHLKDLSSYQDGKPPYPRDVLYAVPEDPNGDKERTNNAVALDFGYRSPRRYDWHWPKGEAKPEPRPLPPPDTADLSTLYEEIKEKVKAAEPAASIYFGFAQPEAQREKIKLLITAETDAQTAALKQNRALMSAFEGAWQAQLESVCIRHGFGFEGFAFGSDELRERDYNGDFNYWLRPRASNTQAASAQKSASKPAPHAAGAAKAPPPLWLVLLKRHWGTLAFAAAIGLAYFVRWFVKG